MDKAGQNSSPPHHTMMSATTGTIAFGTTFLALAAGLAVFAAVRQRQGEGQIVFAPTTTSSAQATTTTTTAPAINLAQISNLASELYFPTEEVEEETTKPTKKTTSKVVTPTNARRTATVKSNSRLASKSTKRSTYSTKTTTTRAKTSTTVSTPSTSTEPLFTSEQAIMTESADLFENFWQEDRAMKESSEQNDFEGGSDITQQLYNAHRSYATTPRSFIPFRARKLVVPMRYFQAAPWPPSGRPASTTDSPLENVMASRHQQQNVLSNVLNDPLLPGPPPVRRRGASLPQITSSNRIYAAKSAIDSDNSNSINNENGHNAANSLPMPQLFADEPLARRAVSFSEDTDATPSTPFLLTLFTAAINSSDTSAIDSSTNKHHRSDMENSNNNARSTEDPLLDISLRQSHRRSVFSLGTSGNILATSSPVTSGHPMASLATSSASSLLAVVALLLFVAVLLIVALFIQRRHFLAKLRKTVSVGHCSVLPLPISVPGKASPTIVDVSDSYQRHSQPSSSSPSSSPTMALSVLPSQQPFSSFRYGDRSGFVIGSTPASPSVMQMQGAMANVSLTAILDQGDDIDMVNSADLDGNLRFSKSSYPMPLHHY